MLDRASDFHKTERTMQKEMQLVASRCQQLIIASAVCLLKKDTSYEMSFLLSTTGQQYNRNSSKTFHSRVSFLPHLWMYARMHFLGQMSFLRNSFHILTCSSSSSAFIWGSSPVPVATDVSPYILLYRSTNSLSCLSVNMLSILCCKLFSSSCCWHCCEFLLTIFFSSNTCSNSIGWSLRISSASSDTIR